MAYADRWEAGAYWGRTIAGTFDFRGRSRRTEVVYWWLLCMVVNAVSLVTLITRAPGEAGHWIGRGVGLLMLFPFFALFWRRLHDQDRTGWFALLLLPTILLGFLRQQRFEAVDPEAYEMRGFASGPLEWAAGGLALIVLVLLFLPGTEGPNRYGEDPRL